jgi:hypothetical protein
VPPDEQLFIVNSRAQPLFHHRQRQDDVRAVPPNVFGSYAQGTPGDRFIYPNSGTMTGAAGGAA